jgi:hypothetical protein
MLGGPVGIGLSIATAGVTLISAAIQAHSQKVQEDTQKVTAWYTEMAKGGNIGSDAADKLAAKQKELAAAQAELSRLQDVAGTSSGTAGAASRGYSVALSDQKDKVKDLILELANGKKGYDEQVKSMTTAEQAQAKVTEATNSYNDALDKFGPGSDQAAAAAKRLAAAQSNAAAVTGDWAGEINTATQALWGNLSAQQAQAGSNQATVSAMLSYVQAQQNLNDVQKNSPGDTLAIAQAQNSLAQAQNGVVSAAQSAAQQFAKNAVAAGQYSNAQDALKAGYQGQIEGLQGLADTLNGPAKQAVLDEITQLEHLAGIDVDPTVTITTDQFDKGVTESNAKLAALAAARAVPSADLDPSDFTNGIISVNKNLDATGNRVTTPLANLNPAQFNAIYGQVNAELTNLSGRFATPQTTLLDFATAGINRVQAALNALHDKAITVTTYNRVVSSGPAGLGGAAGFNASGGLINSDQWSVVGEEGREMVFLSQGQYVATYQKAQKILEAASIQARGLTATTAGMGKGAAAAPVAAASGGVSIPIVVNPAPGMNEAELARKTGNEFAWQFRRI